MTTRELDQTQALEPAKAEAFAGQLLGHLNGAMIALQVSIGHQTGLFDAMAGLPPATSARVAEAAGLNERYVREWLGTMVTGGIVRYDAGTKTYALPPEHAAALTRAAGPGNLAAFAPFVPLLAQVEPGIIDSFRIGGGVPYSAFPRFQRLMAEASGQVFDAALVHGILPLAPGLVERLEAGADVADVGCGWGHAINLMAQAFPDSRFTGYDLSDEAVATARAEAGRLNLRNARFEVADAAALDPADRFDLITAFDAIHDQMDPATVLRNIARALRPEGVFLMVDIAGSSNLEENLGHPLAPWLYTVSTLHCMTVSLAQGGAGLGTMWGEQMARRMLAEAGFTRVDVRRVEGDVLNNYYVARK